MQVDLRIDFLGSCFLLFAAAEFKPSFDNCLLFFKLNYRRESQ